MLCTITTSKRPELFRKTVESFWTKAKDIKVVNQIILADDASTLADRESMKRTISALSGGATSLFLCYVSDEPIGHAESLQKAYDTILNEAKGGLVLMMEDDWTLIAKGCPLLAAMDVLTCNPKVGQVCFGVERPVIWPKYRTRSGTQYMIRPPTISEEGYPAYTLNPSVVRIAALKDVGNYENVEGFERQYGERWNAKGWLVADLYPFWMRHCGDVSAYDLNGTKR